MTEEDFDQCYELLKQIKQKIALAKNLEAAPFAMHKDLAAKLYVEIEELQLEVMILKQ